MTPIIKRINPSHNTIKSMLLSSITETTYSMSSSPMYQTRRLMKTIQIPDITLPIKATILATNQNIVFPDSKFKSKPYCNC